MCYQETSSSSRKYQTRSLLVLKSESVYSSYLLSYLLLFTQANMFWNANQSEFNYLFILERSLCKVGDTDTILLLNWRWHRILLETEFLAIDMSLWLIKPKIVWLCLHHPAIHMLGCRQSSLEHKIDKVLILLPTSVLL